MGLSIFLALMMWSDGCFLQSGLVSPFEHQWYCRQGNAAGLRPLQGERVYRLVLIPSFRPTRVVTVRIESGSAFAEGILLSGRGGYDPGGIARTTRRAVSPENWRLLEQRLENAGVWEAPEPDRESGEDGSQWLLEGRKGERAFFRDVWSPSESTFPQYRKAALFMLELAALEPYEDE